MPARLDPYIPLDIDTSGRAGPGIIVSRGTAAAVAAETLAIGCGAGFSGDRIDAARPVVATLVARGGPAALIFEKLAERTLALAQLARRQNPDARLRAAARPGAAAGPRRLPRARHHHRRQLRRRQSRAARRARSTRWRGSSARRACASPSSRATTSRTRAAGRSCASTLPAASTSALRLRQRLPGRDRDRRGDPRRRAGRGHRPRRRPVAGARRRRWRTTAGPTTTGTRSPARTMAGHLLECGAQVTGGYFADPGRKDVPGLDDVGFPIAEIAADGSCIVTKAAAPAALVDCRTVKEQLLYEVHDPAAYLTPDVVADITEAEVTQLGPDRVRLPGVQRPPAPADAEGERRSSTAAGSARRRSPMPARMPRRAPGWRWTSCASAWAAARAALRPDRRAQHLRRRRRPACSMRAGRHRARRAPARGRRHDARGASTGCCAR